MHWHICAKIVKSSEASCQELPYIIFPAEEEEEEEEEEEDFNLNAHPNLKTLHSLEIAMFPQFAALCRHLGEFTVKIAEIPCV